MVLQKLIQDGQLEVMESLIDMNNTVLKVSVMSLLIVNNSNNNNNNNNNCCRLYPSTK